MKSKQPQPARRALLRGFILLAAFWPGPRPVVHAHAELAATPTGNIELARHLQRHHAQETDTAIDPEQFHCHWVLPGCEDVGLRIEQVSAADLGVNANPAELAARPTAAQPPASWMTAADRELARAALRRCAVARMDGARRSSRLSLHDLFCVRTC